MPEQGKIVNKTEGSRRTMMAYILQRIQGVKRVQAFQQTSFTSYDLKIKLIGNKTNNLVQGPRKGA